MKTVDQIKIEFTHTLNEQYEIAIDQFCLIWNTWTELIKQQKKTILGF